MASDDSAGQYRHNHYVPEWYQRRFLNVGQTRYHYLDLRPEVRTNAGHTWTRNALRSLGPRKCFAQTDLYTATWGSSPNVDIERFFFGEIDGEGQSAVDYFAGFTHPAAEPEVLNRFVRYMSVQKLRTPKGIGYLRAFAQAREQSHTLVRLQRLQDIFGATWSECVWQVADASQSQTKFIVSDHPVTVYNRGCPPGSAACRGFSDPDVRMAATHTLFPLSVEKILILTNLTWARNPYQAEATQRPNPGWFRPTLFDFTAIQTGRLLSDEEVVEMNYVIKMRAHRYIAAAQEEWLYPERHLRSEHWHKLGDGYLFMPEPRQLFMGGDAFVGYKDGSVAAFDVYGNQPSQQGYKDKQRECREAKSLSRFKDEWAAFQGRAFRGMNHGFGRSGAAGADSDSEGSHAAHLHRDAEYRKRPGERARRRKLSRRS